MFIPGNWVDPQMGLQLEKSVEMTLASAVHPVNIKIVVVRVLVKAVGDVENPINGGAVKEDLAIDGRKHVPVRQKQVELVFSNLPDYGIPGLEDIHNEFALPNLLQAILVLLSLLFKLGLRSDALRMLLQLRVLFSLSIYAVMQSKWFCSKFECFLPEMPLSSNQTITSIITSRRFLFFL